MPIPLLFCLLAQTPNQIFDQSVNAYRARKSFSVQIAIDSQLNRVVTSNRYSLMFEPPSRVLLRKMVNGKPALIYWLSGTKLIAYDPATNEMAVRKAPPAGPIANRLASVIGVGIEDCIAVQLSPETMAGFFAPFKSLTGWVVSRQGDRLTLSRTVKTQSGRNQTLFEFSNSTKLLRKALLVGPTSKMQWVYDYAPAPRNLRFAPAPGAITVASLIERPQLRNVETKALLSVEAAVRAYARLNSVAFDVFGTDGASTAWMSGSSFREKQERYEWSYVAGIFTLKDGKTGRAFRGPCKPGQVVTYLKKVKAPMEPVLQGLLLHKNPLMHWIQSVSIVKAGGFVSLGGVPADLLVLSAPTLQIQLLVRRDTHLVASVSSKVTEGARVLSTAERQFRYWTVNAPVPPSRFKIQVTNPLNLSQLGR